MDAIIGLLTHPTGEGFFYLFFKAFAVLFSVSYLVYAIVITRQTQAMNETFKTKSSWLLMTVSVLQIIFGLIVIVASLFII